MSGLDNVIDLTNVIKNVLTKIAHNPRVSLAPADVSKVTNDVEEAVKTEVTSVVAHATNNEPWYQSRVTWGAIISIATPALALVGVRADIIPLDDAVNVTVAVGTAVGGLITIWGRWIARKPIGE